MTLCPIDIVATCKQCPAFKVCALKSIIGDYKPDNTQNKASGSKEKDRQK